MGKIHNSVFIGSASDDQSNGTPGVTDHGLLSGLYDDDHPQYLLRDEYEANNESYRNMSRQATLAVNEKFTIGLDNSFMTALPAIFKKGAPIVGADIDLIREPYTVTPAATGDEVIENVTSWTIPKDQFDYFDFTGIPPFGNTYPNSDKTSWTEKDGWILSAENPNPTYPQNGNPAMLNDGNTANNAGFMGLNKVGIQRYTLMFPGSAWVNKITYVGIATKWPGQLPGLSLYGINDDDTEILIKDIQTITTDAVSFPPVRVKGLVLQHDSAYGNANNTYYGMQISEMGEVLTSEILAQILILADGQYFSIGMDGLTNIGPTPDWSQAVDSGRIDNSWLAELTAPELVCAGPVQLTITYGAIIPQIAIQDNPIDVSGVANITFKAFDDAGSGIRMAMSQNGYVWYVWDGVAFVSIGPLTADSAGADTLYNQGMTKTVYDSIPLADYELFLQNSSRMFFAYGTNNPRAEIVEHRMVADTAAPFVPHTGGTLQLFTDRITYTANVAGDFLFVIST